jgi:lysophospholipase L1-like esterase
MLLRGGRRPGLWVVFVVVLVPVAASRTMPAAAGEVTPLRVLAAGDSFAAGEGLPGIQVGEEACQRALGATSESETAPSEAWPVLVKETFESAGDDARWEVDPFWFVACTGNTSAQFSRQGTQRAGGLSQLAESQAGSGADPWDIVLLSFGGNDVGFAETIRDCIGLDSDLVEPEALAIGRPAALLNGSFAGCSQTEQQIKDHIEAVLPAALDILYSEVAAVTSTGGLITVTGYPQLFADPSVWSNKDKLINRCNRLSEGDARALRGATGYLNQTIGAAVERAAAAHPAQQWVFVDVNAAFESSPPGDTHALCGPDEWINGFSFGGITEGDLRGLDSTGLSDVVTGMFNRSYHPNQAGHAGYATVTASRIRASGWTPAALNSTAAPSLTGEDVCSVVHETIGAEATWVPGASDLVADYNAFTGAAPIELVTGRTDAADLYLGSETGESISRYRLVAGQGIEDLGLVWARPTDEEEIGSLDDVPSGGLTLSIGQGGVSVMNTDGTTPICSFRFDGTTGGAAASPSTGPPVSPTWLCVVDVAEDDVLNIRAEPSPDAEILHGIPPHACDIYPTGQRADVGSATWLEVDFYDHVFHQRGWINGRFVRAETNPCAPGGDPEACGQ